MIGMCTSCDQTRPQGELTEFDGEYLCPSCLERETILCSRCGTRIWADDNAGDDDTPLCEDCYERFYTSCSICGRAISEGDSYYEDDDDEQPLCWTCYCHSQQNREIHGYGYKPEPVFYGSGRRYFGVELEIDCAGEDGESACKIMRKANRGRELIYCKHDGSLDDGFEIVTHPMTLDFHQNSMPWHEVLKEAIDLGYRSHQAGTCGLHVHINRSAFGNSQVMQDSAIARVLYLVEKFWDELLKFSRRTQGQLDHWAARYGYKEQPMQILHTAKEGHGAGRYFAVNLQNYNTIEFRIFRGTLKYNTLIATLQLIDKLCDTALNLSDEPLKALAWTTFVSGIDNPELIKYLKERRLYVNEPVEEGEEI